MSEPEARPKRYKQSPAPGGRPHRIRIQLTDEQLQALQQFSQEHQIGIPQVLVEAYFQPDKPDPRVALRELAGVRRILTDEAEYLRELTADRAASEHVWRLIAEGMQWRNDTLTKRYEW